MSVAKALSRIGKRLILPTAVIGTGAVIGAHSFESAAVPGLKFQAAKEGAFFGAIGGAGLVVAPTIAKVGLRAAKKSAGRAMRNAAKQGKVVFRRIRGRIVPVRIK